MHTNFYLLTTFKNETAIYQLFPLLFVTTLNTFKLALPYWYAIVINFPGFCIT